MQPALEDIDSAVYEQALVKYLMRHQTGATLEAPGATTYCSALRMMALNSKKALGFVLIWCSFRLRVYIICPMIGVATTGLLLSDALTSATILLNGLAIGFICQFDDALASGAHSIPIHPMYCVLEPFAY
jgi:hypothetical protein